MQIVLELNRREWDTRQEISVVIRISLAGFDYIHLYWSKSIRCFAELWIDTSLLSAALMCQWSWSSLVQALAYHLMALSQYLGQCWFHLMNLKNLLASLFAFIAASWSPFQYPIRRLIVRSRKVSKPQDWCLEFSDCSEIWQTYRQHCCWGWCQISEWCDNSNYQSHGFKTAWDLTIRRLIRYWNRVQLFPNTLELLQSYTESPIYYVQCDLPYTGFLESI